MVALRDAILPTLISGETRVSNDGGALLTA